MTVYTPLALDSELSFTAWLEENLGEIEQAQAFVKERISDEPGRLGEQLARSISEASRMGFLLSDVESYLAQSEAAAMLDIVNDSKYQDLSAPDRKILIKERVRSVRRLRDNLKVICDSLKSIGISILNTRNTTFRGPQE